MRQEEIVEVIYKAIDSVNIMLPADRQLAKGEGTVLFGKNGMLDSMGLVSFVLDVEQILQLEHHIDIRLTTEKAMAQERSPFQTVQSLAKFIQSLQDEAQS